MRHAGHELVVAMRHWILCLRSGGGVEKWVDVGGCAAVGSKLGLRRVGAGAGWCRDVGGDFRSEDGRRRRRDEILGLHCPKESFFEACSPLV